LCATNCAECNSLAIAWFEADCGTRGDVKALSVCAATIKRKGSIRLDEVVVRADLRTFSVMIVYHLKLPNLHGTIAGIRDA
jgi:hypothetical protein